MLDAIGSDLRFAGRVLRKSPVFTVVAVLVVAMGTGAVTTIYTAMNALVLRPLQGTGDGGQLVGLELYRKDGEREMTGSYAWYEYLRDRANGLDGVAAWTRRSVTISTGTEGVAANANMVTGNYFSVLRLRPAFGRFFAPDEDRPGATQAVMVVSHRFWQSRLGGDSAIVGSLLRINGSPVTVIGVAPPDFLGIITVTPTDAWISVALQPVLHPTRDLRNAVWLRAFGRLRGGTSADVAAREISELTVQQQAALVLANPDRRIVRVHASALKGLPEDARGMFLGFLALLLGAAGLVLLIASVNVASMLSARAMTRRREMALRTALGAGRARLVRQLLTETLLLFAAGAAGGLVLALAIARGLEQMRLPIDTSLALDLSPDPRVFVFALTVALVTALVFGLAPALQASRQDVTTRLRDDSAGAGTRRGWVGQGLIVGQLALSLVLLVSAGLFIRAVDSASRIDPGFDASQVTTVSFEPESWGYDSVRAHAFHRSVLEEAGALPGVRAAAWAELLPLSQANSSTQIVLDDVGPGGSRLGGGEVRVAMSSVGPEYFDALGIPLRSGRSVLATDDARAPRVVVLNETFARRYWPDGSAVGRTFLRGTERYTVVGIARDSKYASLDEDTPPFAYFAIDQGGGLSSRILVIRSADEGAQLATALQRIVRSLDPGLPRPEVVRLTDVNRVALLPQRVAATTTAILGAVGLLLATVGLYGVISYTASRRTREIGVRMALGASRGSVLGMVVGEGLRLTGAGVVAGLVLAVASTRLIARFLFDVSPLDVLTFAAMSGAFVAVAALASYLPARRAAATDPLTALKAE